jgi:hypothetical protein
LGDGNHLSNVPTTKTSKQLIDQDLNSRSRCKKKHNLLPTISDTAAETLKIICLFFRISNPGPALPGTASGS